MPIYLEKGFKNNKIREIRTSISSFEWLQTYEPTYIQKGDKETTKVYKERIKKLKSNQEYFISGYIEPTEKGAIKRNNEQLIRRDLIIIDYDDIKTNGNDFISHVRDKLPDTAILIYPTINHTDNKPRFRIVIEPSRPLVKYEYVVMLREIASKIGLEYDHCSETWSQCQGLPVKTDLNSKWSLQVIQGKKYEVPRNIEPPIQKNTNSRFIKGTVDDASSIPHEKAIEMFKAYIEMDRDNLNEYSNSNHAILVLAKAVQDGEIDYNTALECSELLAMDNIEWIEGNRQQLNYAVQNTEIRTQYTFKRKFFDLFQKMENPTLDELKHKLSELGEVWREEHATEDKKGKVKTFPVSPRATADILKKTCNFARLGDLNPDTAYLTVYNPDEGIYTKSEWFINNLSLSVERTLSQKQCGEVIHFLRHETEEVERTTSRNLVVFDNGVYNHDTNTLEPFNHEYIFENKIAVKYNPDAKEPKFKDWSFTQWLKDISGDDAEKEELIWQILSSAIHCNVNSDLAVFFYSTSGQTGKSTMEHLLKNLVGQSNTTSLKIKEFEEDFKLASAYGKSLIIGDDNNPKDYNGTSENFKSVITGDPVLINPKGEHPFPYQFTALSIQSMNGIPKFADVSDGMLRRLRVIEFKKAYKDKESNKRVKNEYIKNKELLEWIAFKSLHVNCDTFVNTKESQRIIREIKLDNDVVAEYVEENFPLFKSTKLPVKFLYSHFQAVYYTEHGRATKLGQRTFTTNIKPILEELGWFYSKNTKKPLNGFEISDFQNYKDKKPYSLQEYDFDNERYKYQPLFYKEDS